MNLIEFAWKLFVAVSPFLLAALAWLGTRAAQLIAARVSNERVRGVLLRLDDAVLAAVREVQQVVVDAIKEASADGKLTAHEGAQVKAKAMATIRSHLGPKGIEEIQYVLGLDRDGAERLLSTRVEATVHELKRARAAGRPSVEDALPFAA